MFEFKKIGLIGLGLIGGSLGLEVKKKKIAEIIFGFSRSLETMEKAIKRGIVDKYFEKPENLIKEVDFLILATPISALEEYFKIIKKIRPEILFTDVSSVKKSVCLKVNRIIGKNANFIGSHPISGSEKSGVDFAREGLFEDKIVVLTPTENTKEEVTEKVRYFWERLGSKIIFMSPEKHDKVFGFTSHLPHFLVYTLLYLGSKNKENIKNCFGSGFLDTTRIGKSSPEMWTEIFMENKKNILFWTEKFENELKILKKFLRNGKDENIREILTKSKNYREELE
ncbi:MAG: prephenate dehydrogenase/arogenate dehydrogenase family protein [Candidatus Omnitrophica bacterium]|nr:prephenate dehydrogenase/arogenate dehydrogenase family protein [Candidatus Omnitrophota bacterium]MCM8806857.1 prephenate dehydrogenase/arogenate dehydrogenase family protein [Candidatus Omnitrophota bacterium]